MRLPNSVPTIRDILMLLVLAFALAGCAGSPLPTRAPTAAANVPTPEPEMPVNPETESPTATPAAAPDAPADTREPEATATDAPWRLRIDGAVPEGLIASVRDVAQSAPGSFVIVDDDPYDLLFAPTEEDALANWVYAVAVPFATVEESTSLAQLQADWRNPSTATPIVTPDLTRLLAAIWGAGNGEEVAPEMLVDSLWQRRPAWTLVPFDKLQPSLKVLRVDGATPLDPSLIAEAYPLNVGFGVAGTAEATTAFRALWQGPVTNRDPSLMTKVAMSGVTALVRATAYQMEIRSLLYPGEEVAPVMQAADIAHVSNEVSFVPTCPPPYYIGDPVFCSDPRYMALLEELGVDVVELTGNHLNDWGAQYLPYTLDLYNQAGMQYFGGGRDQNEATQPLIVEHNGNKVAFVGCNPVGPAGGWAGPDRAGSAPCDYGAFTAQIGELAADHVVIATQQYFEIYNYAPTEQQRADFRALATAGAAAVSGSQGHHAQGFDFHEGAFIHYGLGNLFFDQMDRLGTRQTFVDIYTIYDGRLLSVELWTGLIENYARPRVMTAEERAELLQTTFSASGW